MKRNSIFPAWMPMVILSLGMASCISDDSGEGDISIPTLSVEGEDDSDMITYNIYLGSECNITPEITYSGGNESDLAYSWQIGTMANGVKGELEEVSTERALNYMFTKGGTYYAHLTVTDGRVGKAVDYRINVNRTFEEGYLLTSFDTDGSGNLAFAKILTPEEEEEGQEAVIIEHSFETMNEGYSEQKLVNVAIGSVTWPTTIKRVLVSTDKHCYVIDPNNFTILSELNYEDIFPGFSATHFVTSDVNCYVPYAYDSTMKKFVHIELTYMFPYEYQYYVGFSTEDFNVCKFDSWGAASAWTFYMNYTENRVSSFNAYGPYYGTSSYFSDTADLLDGHKLITAFYGLQPGSDYKTPSYILSRNEQTDAITLWTDAGYYYYYETPSEFSTKELVPTADTAVPEQGARIVPSVTQQRYFYALGNCVYVLLTTTSNFALPDKSQYAIKFGANEEVTCLDANVDTDELYVATYDKTTQRGSLYVYSCKDVRTDNSAGVRPTLSYKDCAGRITNVLYKPSIQ